MNQIKVVLDTGEKHTLLINDWQEDAYVEDSGCGRTQVQGGTLHEDVGGVVIAPPKYKGCRVSFMKAPTHMIGGSHWDVSIVRV